MKKILFACAVAFGWLYLTALLAYHLSNFPGLHGDEAWAGMFASRILSRGFYSPHEMNTYTGSIYGGLLALIFLRFPRDVLHLRMASVAFNSLAALIMLIHLARRTGGKGAAAWLYLLTTSAFFVFDSKLAWEITAFQNLLLACLLVLCARFLEDAPASFWGALAFIVLNYAGVVNHFIFISVPASLMLAALAMLVLRGNWDFLDFFRLSICNFLMAVLVFLLKPRVADAQWESHKPFFLALTALIPVACAMAYVLSQDATPRLRALCERARGSSARTLFLGTLALGMALFFFFHLKALIQIWSGVALFERMSSWIPPLPARVILYAWSAYLIGLFLASAYRGLEPGYLSKLSPYGRFLIVWPLVYAAVFVVFRNTNSIRYYIIPSFLFMASLAAAAARTPLAGRRKAAAVCLCAAAVLNVSFWREMAGPRGRRPLVFRVGWHKENSRDFLPKDALNRAMDEERVCGFQDYSSFIDIPLDFYRWGHPVACDETKYIATRYCEDCPGPPYIAWEIKTKRRAADQ